MNDVNFYLLYCENKDILNKEINDIKKKLNINDNSMIYYDIEDVNNIIDEASTINMFGDNKLLIINGTAFLSEKKDVVNIKLLEDYLEHYNKNSYLVFVSYKDNIDSRKKIVKLISSNGILKKIELNDADLNKYVNKYLNSCGYKMNNLDVIYFLNRVGTNINNITNELDKLMLYKEKDKNILREDITKLTIENIDNPMYDLVGFILKNENKKAIELYNNFIQNGMDAAGLIPVIAAQIRLLFQVKRLYNQGKTNDEIAKLLEIKNVYRIKYLISDGYYYAEDDLLKYLSRLANLDRDIKLGLIDPKVSLELFIVGKDM